MGKTKVFISSTCYDLSQIRKDLKEGIREMGHVPILSEDKDFPIDPGLSSAENCINVVRNEADIFVLIIGNKYGSKLESGQSITNTEFLTAVEKGIPVYTFSLKQMIQILPIWKNNRQIDFSHIVDDNKIFEFLEDVREKRSKWNFEFESAQDILEILKSQLSILFQRTLENNKKLESVDSNLITTLSGKALRILVDKGPNYEIKVFLQMMQDEFDKYRFLRMDCIHAVCVKSGPYLRNLSECISWQAEMLTRLEKSLDTLNRLFITFNQYIGEPGVASDIDGLYYVAHRFGDYYAFLLNWVIEVRSAYVDDDLSNLISIVSELPISAIEQLEAYPYQSMHQIDAAYREYEKGSLEKGTQVQLMLHLRYDEQVHRRLLSEIKRLNKEFGK